MSRFLLAVAASALLLSCSLDYEGSQLSEDLDDDIPEITLRDVTHTVVREGVKRFVVVASLVEDYPGKKQQLLTDVTFTEYRADGIIATSGTAASAVFYTESENVDLSGGLQFYSTEEQAWVTTDALTWDSEARLLSAPPEDTVRVWKSDGTSIVGQGFSAETSRNTINFDRYVRGTLVEE